MSERGGVNGRVVVVTGAARGIGAATARELARRGATLSLIGIEPERLAELVAELGEQHAAFNADVRDQAALDKAIADTMTRFGRIDALIANAGVVNYGTVRTADPDSFASTIEVNLTGVYRTVHAAAPQLIASHGYVLIIASLASFMALPGGAAYAASKAGVLALANSLRAELAGAGVMVGSAHPGWIDTDLVRSAEDAMPAFREIRRRMPWPGNSTTSVARCAEMLADGIEARARRVYVPRSIRLVPALRPLLESALSERLIRRRTNRFVADVDRDVERYNETAPRRIS